MANLSIPAHFDGDRILLDVPVTLKPNAKLLVTVLPENDEERRLWARLSGAGLAGAYGNMEPDYPVDLIKEPNPEYAGR